MIICGDCKTALKKIRLNSVDLIYLDPPFFTQKRQTLKDRDYKEYSYEDRWPDICSYTHYIQERLEECRRVLKPAGSIFLHCDRSASHHLRIALDEVFGSKNFQSEIVWSYRRWSNSKKGLLSAHQIIFFYSKTKKFKFNRMYTNYSPTTNLDQIFQKRARNKNGKTVYKLSKDGQVELMAGKKGVPLSDVWEIPYLNPKAKERAGYPTQKPILLLERIIKLATCAGDLVLDPFCGSGTALVAAKLLKRRYIGIDKARAAAELSRARLKKPFKTESLLLKDGARAFSGQDPKIRKILSRLPVVPARRNRGIDGFLKMGDSFKPVPVRIQREGEALEAAAQLLERACARNGYQKRILIQTNQLKSGQLSIFKERGRERERNKSLIVSGRDKTNSQGRMTGSFRQNKGLIVGRGKGLIVVEAGAFARQEEALRGLDL